MGTSNKSLMIYDICKESIIRIYENAHERTIHSIVINEYPNVPNDSNLIMSSGLDNTIKLWDIRVPDKCIRRFQEHKNTVYTIGCHISPCMKFLVTGSEDRNIYIYDVSSGSRMYKLQSCHSDIVSCVQFSPQKSFQMASSSFDGTVKFFKNSE
jgi:WD40 repeat protein